MEEEAFLVDAALRRLNILVNRAVFIQLDESISEGLVVSYVYPYRPEMAREGQALTFRSPTMAAPATAHLGIRLSPSAAESLILNIVNEGSNVQIVGRSSAPIRLGNLRLENSSAGADHVALTGGLVTFRGDHGSSGRDTVQKPATFTNVVIENKQLIKVSGMRTTFDVSSVRNGFTETPLTIETDSQTPEPILSGLGGRHIERVSDHGIPLGNAYVQSPEGLSR